MLKISVMTWKSYMTKRNLHKCNNGIVVLFKVLRKTMCHKDTTIFHYHLVSMESMSLMFIFGC